jgi:hypothetical protein
MKTFLSLMLALTVSAASFATQPASTEPVVNVTATSASKIRLFVAQEAAKASIALWDAAGNQLYFERVNLKSAPFRQNFDISNLTDGTYQFTISTGESTITRTLVVETKPAQRSLEIKS